MFHVAGQLVHAQRREGFALGLGHVEHGHGLKGRPRHFLGDGDGPPVRAGLFPLHLLLIGTGGQNLNAVFPPLDVALKVLLPVAIARHAGGVRALHVNQQGIACRIVVKLGHGFQVVGVLAAGKQVLQALFQLVGDLLQPVAALVLICHRKSSFLRPIEKAPARVGRFPCRGICAER